MSQEQFAYVSAGAGEGDVIDENETALARWRLVPRALRVSADPEVTTELFGIDLAAPIMLAPVRGLDYIRAKGQDLTARAAARCRVPLVLSNLASSTLEQVAHLLGNTPRFLQLYPCNDHELVKSLLKRAEMASYSGVVLTVDMAGNAVQYQGPKTSEYMNFGNEIYLSDPLFQSRLKQPVERDRKAALELIRRLRHAVFTWEDVELIQRETRLPVILKGILSPEDAKEAQSRGVSGLVVSNHGGRAMSGEAASIDMLPEIVDITDAKLAVLYDGGIRSGIDVLKALALGAKAVLIGRAYAYALASAGEEGVISVLNTILKELKSGLITCGCPSTQALGRTLVRRFP